ncbi:hybrid sensor histidine kinase/response regulator [Filimonas effusa]|uniref:histidine kinase n=1 Tax=Filimonas effusa TaxID=2508721 RepID=A0A4Q1DCH6_9BACT|nr:ATP-binding protein [Filimonas effusa]RXK87167.1 response regulator [Filimonas effusa]
MNQNPRSGQRHRLLLSFVVFVALLAVVAFVSRQLINRKGKFLLSVIESNSAAAEQSGEVLLLLHQAEQAFQSAVLSHQPKQLTDYKVSLETAFLKIDSIRRRDADTSFILDKQERTGMRELYRQKLLLSNEIFALKKSFDSVLTVATILTGGATQAGLIDSVAKVSRQRTAAELQKEDTVHIAETVVTEKKGFFKKLKAAFSSGQDTLRSGGGAIINKQTEKNYRDSINRTVLLAADASFQQLLKTLSIRQRMLLNSQGNLFAANREIMGHLKQLVTRLQSYENSLSGNIRKIALNEYRSTRVLLNNMAAISLLLVFLFAMLLVFYIRKIKAADRQLQHEYELATTLAQQKTDLLATMSHEIRNPLNSIIGFLQELKKSGLSPQQSEMLSSVQLSSDMLLGTVTNALDMSKLESGKFQLQTEQFNAYNTIRQTAESMRITAHQKKLLLNYHFTGDKELNITGDGFRLKQILINLLSNAIKYTNEGSITIKAGTRQQHDKVFLEISIIDTGVGIAKAQQALLFTKYYQASSSKGTTGTGLGLYICYNLIQAQQGTIKVESEPGQGTHISFAIPYTPVAKPTSPKQNIQLHVDISVFSGKRILVADDNELNLRLLRVMMQHWEVTLLLVKNGREAMQLLEKERVDLVLTDMDMAEMNGSELLAAIRTSAYAALPVVLSTAYHYTAAEEAELYGAGFTGIIIKPYNESLLAQKLFAALQMTERPKGIKTSGE